MCYKSVVKHDLEPQRIEVPRPLGGVMIPEVPEGPTQKATCTNYHQRRRLTVHAASDVTLSKTHSTKFDKDRDALQWHLDLPKGNEDRLVFYQTTMTNTVLRPNYRYTRPRLNDSYLSPIAMEL
jgi:hypothetical protein